jgi:hypothetical protein
MSTENTETSVVDSDQTQVQEQNQVQEADLQATQGHTDAKSIDADPTLSKAEKVEAKKALNELRIKYNGKDVVEKLPFEIPDTEDARNYMAKHLQMSKLAQTKGQEAAEIRQQVLEFIEEIKKNPRKALSDPSLGVDFKKMAAEIIEEEIEQSKKSPEQLEKERLELELRKVREELKRKEDEQRSLAEKQMEEQEYQRYSKEITEAISEVGLPNSDFIRKKTAEYLQIGFNDPESIGLKAGERLHAKDVINLVKEDIMGDLKNMYEAFPDDVFEKMFENKIKNVRKRSIAKAKDAQPSPSLNQVKDVAKSKPSEKVERVSMKKFFGI